MVTAFAVEASRNEKTGLVHTTYASQRSCPDSCPLKNEGCYAEHGPIGIHTKRLNRANPNATAIDVARDEAHAIRETLSGRLDMRIHVVGDCSSNDAASLVSDAATETLKRGRQAWTYTHAWKQVDRKAWGDVSVLASCDNLALAKQAKEQGWATAVIVDDFPSDRLYERDGMKILPCPNQTRKVQCVDCRLCFDEARLRMKGITIGFKAHGSRRTRVLQVINQ